MSGSNTPIQIDLGSHDAAFVLRADGELELIVPRRADDERVPEDEVALIAFATKFRDERLRELLSELLEKPLH